MCVWFGEGCPFKESSVRLETAKSRSIGVRARIDAAKIHSRRVECVSPSVALAGNIPPIARPPGREEEFLSGGCWYVRVLWLGEGYPFTEPSARPETTKCFWKTAKSRSMGICARIDAAKIHSQRVECAPLSDWIMTGSVI